MNATRFAVTTVCGFVLTACAAAPQRGVEPLPSALATDSEAVALDQIPVQPFAQIPATGGSSEAPSHDEVCEPEVIDSRAALDDSCLNLIEDLNKRGNRIDATTRHKKERPSLCDSMWLPRCRHKY